MSHLMIDIETAGTRPGSAILSIGAVIFDESGVTQEWECGIDFASCKAQDFIVDDLTMAWWECQSIEAQEAAFGGTTHIADALTELFEFCQDEGVTHFWSHGATADLVWLTEAALIVEVEPILSRRNYWAARDTRTLFELVDVNPKTFMGTGTAHKAIDDARAQALAVIEAWRIIARWRAPQVAVKVWPGLNREAVTLNSPE